MNRLPVLTCAFSMLLSAISAAAETTAPNFEADVRPLLKAYCFECHGEGKMLEARLDLRLRRFLVAGGESGAAIQPGDSQKSLLIEKLTAGEMPPGKKKLTAAEIAVIAKWIDSGANTLRDEPEKLAVGFQMTDEERRFWFFQPLQKLPLPAVKSPTLVRSPIDTFLLSKLEAQNFSFASAAERRTLIRRATFDLIGLPPTPDEVTDFVQDDAPDAFQRLVDRLLASPHYGERWGRHWLDVAGYADSEGYNGEDLPRASAFRYRDYVIRSFGSDKPFDEFIHEQLAGDELLTPPYERTPPAQWDKLIATGFLRMAPDGTSTKDVDLKEAGNQSIADTIQIVSTSLLGLTVQCAQCHNHRYDPIPQVDYFKMRAIFEPALDWKSWRLPIAREVRVFSDEARTKIAQLEEEAKAVDADRVAKTKEFVKKVFDAALGKVPDDEKEAVQVALKAGAKRTDEQKKLIAKFKGITVDAANVSTFDEKAKKEIAALTAQATKIRGNKPGPEPIRALTEIPGKIPATFLFERGDPSQPSDEVSPGHLTILANHSLPEISAKDAKVASSGRRLAFARSLTSEKNPLTPRVLVNRFWMHHFGKGLVASAGDFGQLGERPTHPELLDWLASDFVEQGWSVQRFHRRTMLSAAYQQASVPAEDSQLVEKDPDNKLVGRMSVRRLEAEVVRDAMLAASGQLNRRRFGEPIPIRPDLVGQIVIGVDTRDGAGRPTGKVVPLNGEEFRRSMYVTVRRSTPLAMLETFDGAMVTPNCESRNTSTVTPQSLLLMNSPDVLDQATFLARRLQREASGDLERQVKLAWSYGLSHEPTAEDQERATKFVADQIKFYDQQKNLPKDQDALLVSLANLCQAILSSNSFLYVD